MGESFEVLVVTHGGLSRGYRHAMELLLDIGEKDMGTLSFEEGEEIEHFREKLSEYIEGKYKDKNLVILLDLPGGTPANTALSFMNPSRRLIAGFSLPLLLELMVMKMGKTKWEELDIEDIISNSRNSMVYYNEILRGKEND